LASTATIVGWKSQDEGGEFIQFERRRAGERRVTRREKLIEKMRRTPGNIRFTEVENLLRHEGFVLFNARGSHRTYHHGSGRALTELNPPQATPLRWQWLGGFPPAGL
jgi:hypothetical protein